MVEPVRLTVHAVSMNLTEHGWSVHSSGRLCDQYRGDGNKLDQWWSVAAHDDQYELDGLAIHEDHAGCICMVFNQSVLDGSDERLFKRLYDTTQAI